MFFMPYIPGKTDKLLDFYNSRPIEVVISFLSIPLLAFLIYNISIWSKKDKRTGTLIALLFLNMIYVPFYFRNALKNGWV